MRKTLIKIVSVITLVFGTCYQSVLALADDRDRTELSGVQLSDSKGNKLHQVKVNETNELEMTVTVNNKDGENKDGKAAMWLPEDQLKVLQEQVKAESAVTDTNATLIYERRKNNQSLVEWKNVETSATFNLKLPVQFTSTMTSMALPIALGTQHGYLQPLSVVSEDATEEEMKEAGTPTGLPADILGSLTSFINSQQAQQAQKAQQAQEEQQKQQAQQNAEQKAPAKDENEDKDTVKEEAAKEEAEAKRDAEKKAEQEAADKDKEAAKTRDALKKNSKTADAESKTDGAKRESQDKKETKAEGRNLNELLADNTGANKSLFESIEINQNGQITPVKPNEPLDVSDLKDKDFELVYKWDSTSLQEKIKGDIQNEDFYTLRIEGLKYNGDKTSGELLDNGGQEFAKWEIVKSEGDYQEIKIIFTNEKANLTQVDYTLRLSQTYTGENPIEFEQSADAIWTGKPAEVKSLLGKSGHFVNDNEIQWEITLKKDGDIKFSDLKLEDVINMKGAKHTFLPETLDIFYSDDENLKLLGMFNEPDFSVENKMTLTGKTPEESANPKDDLVQRDITIRIRTKIENQKGGTFYNQIGGQVSDDIRLNNVEASVTTAQLDKTRTKYENGVYTWKADVTLNLDQFKDSEGNIDEDKAIQAIQNMKITDELSGPHQFQDNHGLLVMVGGSNVTTSFDVNPKAFPSNELVLTPKENEAKTILEALKANNTGKLTLTYNTKETEKGDLSAIRNKISLEYEGNSQFTEAPGNTTGLIVKDGERSLKVHEDGKLHIDWKLTANQGHRKFKELKVTDVLPAGVDHDNVKSIEIGDEIYELNGPEENDIKVVKGWVSGIQGVGGDNPYNFSEDKDAVNNPRAAIQFIIGESHSTKEVKISFETIHEWNQDNNLDRIDYHTNYVGAATEEGLYQYTNKTVAIDQELQRGGKKGAKLHLDDKLVDPAKGNNYITWSIDFGGRLNDYFGKGDKQIDTIKITDKLNENGPKYLSYPEDKNDYTLYHLDSNRGNPQVVPRDQYDINWPPSSDGRGHREFTITFNDKAENKNYTNLRLEFDTRIDFDAWREVKPTPDTIPDPYTFLNTADVEYGDRKLEGLKNKVEVSSKGLDGQKTVEAGEGNALNWEILFNTRSKDIGQPTITDTLSPNQRHSINGIELAFVTPKFELNPNGTGYVVTVDKSKPQDVLEVGKDYSIHVDGNQKLTIQLKTDVERPLVIRYSTIMENSSGPYTNHAEIDARGHSTTYTTEHKLSGNAIMNVWPLRLLKVNGADNDKPLPGTTFRLEQRKLNSNDSWQPASRVDTGKDYGEIVSDENGLIEFEGLGTNLEYQLVEVSPSDEILSQMEPLQFNQKQATDAGWMKETHKIKNYPVTPGNLTLSKATKNLDNGRSFNFEVRAVDKQGNVNTGLQGTYKLQEVGEVTFHNGVSEEVSVPANKERTILGLPTEKVDASGNKSTQYYDVRETSTSDEYNTQVAVGNDDPIWSKQTEPFELSTSTATPVMIFFTNTAAKGDLVVSKTVSSKTEDEMDAKYDFTIQAKSQKDIDKVAGKTYEVDGAGLDELKFDSAGKATFSLKHTQKLTVMGLPEGVELTVTEEKVDMTTTWSINGADYTSTSGSVTINPDKTQTYDFKNSTEKSGQLQITKQIAGDISADEVFKFEIKTDSSVDGKYPYETYTVSNQHPGQAGMVEFKGGELTTPLSLKGDEYVKITNLPLNKEFAVKEIAPKDTDIKTTWQIGTSKEEGRDAAPITLKNENDIASVTFTNQLPNGSLTLDKNVVGLPGDEATKFEFTIQASDENSINKVKNKTFTDAYNVVHEVDFDKDGKANISLRDSQRVKIIGLPAGINLRISEANNPDFNASYKVDGESADEDDADGPTVTIKDDGNTAVSYTNTRTKKGDLMLEKRAEGSYPTDKAIGFTISALDDEELNREFTATLTQTDGTSAQKNVKFDGGKAEVAIKPGEKLLVKGLPAGEYQVKEDDQEASVTTTWDIGETQGDNELANPITVEDKDTAHVLFTNKIATGSLMLEKRAEGSYPIDKTIDFAIKALDENKDLNGNYDATLRHIDGTSVQQKVNFESGKADVSIKPGEKLEVKNLPLGDYQVIEEDQDSLVTTTWEIGNNDGKGLATDEATIKEDNTTHVLFTNKIATGKLELNKFVASHEAADKDKNYKFQIRTINSTRWMVANKSYDVTGLPETKRIEFNDKGRAEIFLKGDQTATISGLPEGVRLAVIETDSNGLIATWNVNNGGSYQELTQRNRPQTTITEDQTEVVSYRNVRDPVGSLRVDKVVKGAYTDDHRKFEFTVDAQTIKEKENDDDADEWIAHEAFNGEYEVKIYNSSNNELQETTKVEFKDGQATLELKADQYAVINNLPLNDNERFQVSEVDPDIANMSTTWAVNNGTPADGLEATPVTLDEKDVPRVTFTNSHETGNLVLEKKLSGEITDADRNQTFEFTVDAQVEDKDNQGEWLTDENFAGDYTATKTTADGRQTTSSVTFTDGQLTVSLKGGERLQISNLPANMRMVISETPDGDYETSHQIDHGSVTPGTTTDQITIPNGGDQAVTFINDRPAQPQTAWLSVTKSVLGENGERDRGFEFSIRFLDDEMNPLTGTIGYVKTSPIGGYTPGQMMLDANGNGTFTLMDGETIRWQVPNGTHYQITESDYAADGYQTSISQGQAPEREGLTATGVLMTNDPANAKVVYYNRADPTPEDEPHTPENPGTDIPGFVPPAPESGGTDTPGSVGSLAGSATQGTAGTTAPQAHVSGSSAGTKGFLPQTGEWIARNWVLLLGLVMLLSAIGLMVRSKRKKG